MKYRHSFHAGNFADVHKHVTLLALLAALKRKPKGFLYLETHAGRGSYDLSSPSHEAQDGIGRFLAAEHGAPELLAYRALLARFRAAPGQRHRYPGSPLIAALELRSQDRAVLIEWLAAEAHSLEASLEKAGTHRAKIERDDGFERLRAFLPPAERRALIFIDPPYEHTAQDFARVSAALADGLRRFPTGVFAAWYPIKEERTTAAWLAHCTRELAAPVLVSELWIYPRDSRVGLNGSGLLIANPPYLAAARMKEWLPELSRCLARDASAGASVRMCQNAADA